MSKNNYIDEGVKKSLERYKTDITVLTATLGADLVALIFTALTFAEKNDAYKLGSIVVGFLSMWAIGQHQSLKNSESDFLRNVSERRLDLKNQSTLFLRLGEHLARSAELSAFFTEARKNQ